MINPSMFEECASKLSRLFSETPIKDVERHIRSILSHTFSKLDLVTREEFDLQIAIIAKLRTELAALETRLEQLEQPAVPPTTKENS